MQKKKYSFHNLDRIPILLEVILTTAVTWGFQYNLLLMFCTKLFIFYHRWNAKVVEVDRKYDPYRQEESRKSEVDS